LINRLHTTSHICIVTHFSYTVHYAFYIIFYVVLSLIIDFFNFRILPNQKDITNVPITVTTISEIYTCYKNVVSSYSY